MRTIHLIVNDAPDIQRSNFVTNQIYFIGRFCRRHFRSHRDFVDNIWRAYGHQTAGHASAPQHERMQQHLLQRPHPEAGASEDFQRSRHHSGAHFRRGFVATESRVSIHNYAFLTINPINDIKKSNDLLRNPEM